MNGQQLKVSIIVPVYNAEDYLEACIDSILMQDYKDIELILINDGSVDASGRICEKYAQSDPRVVYRYQNNAGVSSARNHGLDLATGEYIAFVDSDDQLKQGAISVLVCTMMEKKADLCICGYDAVTKDQTTPYQIAEETIVGEEYIAAYFSAHFLEAIASSVWGKLYKRAMITHRFDRTVTMGEDLLFNLEYIRKTQTVQAIAGSFYVYNKQNINSLANNYRISYYKQDVHVVKEWLRWLSQFPSITDTNLCYRISSAFFCVLQIVCGASGLEESVQQIKTMVNEELLTAIEKTVHRYNFAQKVIFWLLLNSHYTMVVLIGKVYIWLKSSGRSGG